MNHYFGPPNEFTHERAIPYLPDDAFWRPLDRHFAAG